MQMRFVIMSLLNEYDDDDAFEARAQHLTITWKKRL